MMLDRRLQLQRMAQVMHLRLFSAKTAVCLILIAAHPGLRRLLGTANLVNTGYFETCEQMMKPVEEGGKPSQFRAAFRMWPGTFTWLEHTLWKHVQPQPAPGSKRPRGRPAGSRNRQTFHRALLMTLWFLGRGAAYADIAAQFGVSSIDYRDLLIDELAAMFELFVIWPRGADFGAACAEFSRLKSRDRDQEFGFNRCCGCLDGTFIRINRPLAFTFDLGAEHNTYKKYYAIQAVLVCMTNFVITYAHVGTAGSHPDIWILKRSDLYLRINSYIRAGSYMLADSGLQLFTWMLIPFSGAAATQITAQRARLVHCFNLSLQSARVVIEQTNGILKGRWRILHNGIQADLPHARPIVMACIVLHNICQTQEQLHAWPTSERIARQDQDLGFEPPEWAAGDTGRPDPHQRTTQEGKGAGKAREAAISQIAPSLVARTGELALRAREQQLLGS
jgi:hypothetical protein